MRLARIHGIDRGFADVLGGDEIGIATAKIDDIDPLRLQRARLI
ncbi:MAG: hypothetical protein R2843_06395 [Thermomicrobiales bacterium]